MSFCGDAKFDELARGELFSRCLVSEFEFSHSFFLLLDPRSRCRRRTETRRERCSRMATRLRPIASLGSPDPSPAVAIIGC
ncbi:hypothetical protein BZL30_7234 [Mycobacterium kansasii]|uniref:Uncharacterized protein n=1 Tax=Mycobacterium kansasii TaxID=1768 RepID=A0A1V3WQK8_MYCKA|nr:hypothetical protein BZL30_7234 [Mycobacterium kansasii]